MEVVGVLQPGELATRRRWWNSSSRETHLGGAESRTLGRDRGMGAEEDFLGRISDFGESLLVCYLGLSLAGGWNHLGPWGGGGEEGPEEGKWGEATLAGGGGWHQEEGQ